MHRRSVGKGESASSALSPASSAPVKIAACGLYFLGVMYALAAWADPAHDKILPTALVVFALPLLLRVLFPQAAAEADRSEREAR